MPGLAVSDYLALIGYAVIIVITGVYSMRRVRNTEDFFIGGRSFGKFLTVFAQYGESVSAHGPIMTADETFRHGLSGIWITLTNLFLLPVYWFYYKWLRRFRYVTISDLLDARYRSRWLTSFHAVFSLFCLAAWVSVGFTAMGESITKILSVHMDLDASQSDRLFSAVLAITAVLILAYGICGGIRAAVLTDCIQTMFMIFFTVILIPLAFSEAGGLDRVRQAIPDHLLDLFGGAASTYTWYFVFALTLTMIAATPAWPSNMLANVAKDERTVQIGVILGFLLKRISIIAWGVVGLLAILYFTPGKVEPGQVYGVMTMRLLAPLGFGLVGLVLAGLMAALMSTADTHMIAAAATFTENVYKPLVVSGGSERHYMFVGRVASFMFLLVTTWIAYTMREMVDQFLLSWEALAVFGPVFWLGFVWRRANAVGAFMAVLGGLLIVFVLPVLACFTPLATDPAYLIETRTVTTTYDNQIATQYDVDEGQAARVGDVFSFTQESQSVPVFFTELKETSDGGIHGTGIRGTGRLRPVLVLMRFLGVRVEGFNAATVKAIHLLFPTLLSFILMYVGSKWTRPRMSKETLDDFYGRMLTPAMGKPPEEDAREVAENVADFDERLKRRHVFPDSDWVIERPDAFTVIGFFVVCLVSAAVFGIVWLISIGLRG